MHERLPDQECHAGIELGGLECTGPKMTSHEEDRRTVNNAELEQLTTRLMVV